MVSSRPPISKSSSSVNNPSVTKPIIIIIIMQIANFDSNCNMYFLKESYGEQVS